MDSENSDSDIPDSIREKKLEIPAIIVGGMTKESTSGQRQLTMAHREKSQVDLYQNFSNLNASKESSVYRLKKELKKLDLSPSHFLMTTFPILSWLPKYDWKNNFIYDLMAGFQATIIHLPQGMAAAMLANLPPIVGIYMAFFSPIIYGLMGTSPHTSIGTEPIVNLITGKAISDFYLEKNPNFNSESLSNSTAGDPNMEIELMEVATALTALTGILQVIFGFFRFGTLSLLIAGELYGGFIFACSIHVLTAQFKNFLGIPIPRRDGLFRLYYTIKDIINEIGSINTSSLTISIIVMTTLGTYNEMIKPHVKKKTKYPIPVELMTIILATVASNYWDMENTLDVKTIHKIDKGLPSPTIPNVTLFQDLLMDALSISIIAFINTISLAKIFAAKHQHQVDENQEFIAMGAGNVLGSFFSCAPNSSNLSRCGVLEMVGVKTQMAGILSSLIMFFILFWILPCFKSLPLCVLSSIIVVAMRGMFKKCLELPKVYRKSRINAFIWIASFLSTLILNFRFGIGIGLFLSVASLIWRSNRVDLTVLGILPNSEMYDDVKRNELAIEHEGIKIIKYTGSLNFLTAEFLQGKLSEILAFKENPQVRWLILDVSSVISIDPKSAQVVQAIYKKYNKARIRCLFAGAPHRTLRALYNCAIFKEIGREIFYPTVHDAVMYAKNPISYCKASNETLSLTYSPFFASHKKMEHENSFSDLDAISLSSFRPFYSE